MGVTLSVNLGSVMENAAKVNEHVASSLSYLPSLGLMVVKASVEEEGTLVYLSEPRELVVAAFPSVVWQGRETCPLRQSLVCGSPPFFQS